MIFAVLEAALIWLKDAELVVRLFGSLVGAVGAALIVVLPWARARADLRECFEVVKILKGRKTE